MVTRAAIAAIAAAAERMQLNWYQPHRYSRYSSEYLCIISA